jgi:hypothetical protein
VDGTGFKLLLAAISDYADGFDNLIYRAACSHFAAHVADVDTADPKESLSITILDVDFHDDRNETLSDVRDIREQHRLSLQSYALHGRVLRSNVPIVDGLG